MANFYGRQKSENSSLFLSRKEGRAVRKNNAYYYFSKGEKKTKEKLVKTLGVNGTSTFALSLRLNYILLAVCFYHSSAGFFLVNLWVWQNITISRPDITGFFCRFRPGREQNCLLHLADMQFNLWFSARTYLQFYQKNGKKEGPNAAWFYRPFWQRET